MIVKPGPNATVAELREYASQLEQAVEATNAPGTGEYEVIAPSGTFKNHTLRMTIPGTKAIFGSRAKFLGIIAEVKSGRLEKFLSAHTELK